MDSKTEVSSSAATLIPMHAVSGTPDVSDVSSIGTGSTATHSLAIHQQSPGNAAPHRPIRHGSAMMSGYLLDEQDGDDEEEQQIRLELAMHDSHGSPTDLRGSSRLHKWENYRQALGHLPLPAQAAIFYWNTSNRREKWMAAISVLGFLLAIVFASLYFSHLHPPAYAASSLGAARGSDGNDTSRHSSLSDTGAVFPNPTTVCLSKDCVVQSANMLSMMDPHVDPCTDFYQYACGSWIRRNPIPSDRSRYGQFEVLNDRTMITLRSLLESPPPNERNTSILESNLYTMYTSCMNISHLESRGVLPIRPYVHRLTETFPIFDFEYGLQEFTEALVFLHKLRIPSLFKFSVSLDRMHSDRNIVYVEQAGLGLPSKEYYSDRHMVEYYELIMLEYFETILGDRDLGWDVISQFGSRGHFMARVNDVMSLEKQLASISINQSLQEFQTLYPFVDWIYYVKQLMPLDFEIPDAANFTMVDLTPSYFDALASILSRHRSETIRYYFLWHLLLHFTDYLSEDYRRPSRSFDKLIRGTDSVEPRWHECVRITTNAMGFVAGELYVQNSFSAEQRLQATSIVNQVRDSFRARLATSESWLDEGTRKHALEKEKLMVQKIGYPDFLFNRTAMQNRYRLLHVDAVDYFQNAVYVEEYLFQYEMSGLSRPVDRGDWNMFPQTVNAYYSRHENAIVFPAALFQPPFFMVAAPDSINYGSVGSILGHEMSHGFDQHGRLYDGQGNLNSWWSNASLEQFENASKCFFAQYSNFNVMDDSYLSGSLKKQKDLKVNANLTLGEIIADNGGLRIAWDAWKAHDHGGHTLPGMEKWTPEQQFFLGFAQNWCSVVRPQEALELQRTDPHPPSRARVNGALSNFYEFSRTFQCPVGKPLRHEPACELW